VRKLQSEVFAFFSSFFCPDRTKLLPCYLSLKIDWHKIIYIKQSQPRLETSGTVVGQVLHGEVKSHNVKSHNLSKNVWYEKIKKWHVKAKILFIVLFII
jgi:hypothetical protein